MLWQLCGILKSQSARGKLALRTIKPRTADTGRAAGGFADRTLKINAGKWAENG